MIKIDIGMHPRYEVVEVRYIHELEDVLTYILTNDLGQNKSSAISENLFRWVAELLLNGEIDTTIHTMDDVRRWIRLVKP